MRIPKPVIPKEIDADVAISIILSHAEAVMGKNISCRYEFKGVSERTALGDDLRIGIKNRQDETTAIKFSLKRDSIYHILPEYLFHPLDYYLCADGDTEEFEKLYKKQEEQKNNALNYFKPFDQHFQQLRINYQKWLNEHVFSGNQFLSDFITQGYGVNIGNPFIKAVYPCIAWLRDYRGNEEMLRTALGYAFSGNAKIEVEHQDLKTPLSDDIQTRIGCLLDEMYCGSTFNDRICVWKVFYQVRIDTAERLKSLKRDIKEFSDFFTMWFLPIEAKLDIEFGDRLKSPILSKSSDSKSIFLNYSTQLI